MNSGNPALKIRKRDMEFDFSDGGRLWNGESVFLTVIFNSLSVMLPEGESYMIKVARKVVPQVKDENLRAEVRGFIAQEATHSAQHRLYNDQLRAQGYPVDRMERFVRRQLNLALKYLPLKWNAAMMACFEHYTALIGDASLTNQAWLGNANNGFGDLWRWHAVEEVEHKSVTFDMYNATGGGYILRCFVMIILTINFFSSLVILQAIMLHHDKKLFHWPTIKRGTKFFFTKSQIFPKYLLKYLAFFNPSFHPWNDDNKTLINDWKAEHDQ